ncbi:MAG TPA: hypothetical protein V6C71_22295 [Coleofasciculaceae cyanobacterium]|jgi:hypothetical protein
MKSSNWKKRIGLGLGVFALLIGSAGITGCETQGGGGGEQQEVPPAEPAQ